MCGRMCTWVGHGSVCMCVYTCSWLYLCVAWALAHVCITCVQVTPGVSKPVLNTWGWTHGVHPTVAMPQTHVSALPPAQEAGSPHEVGWLSSPRKKAPRGIAATMWAHEHPQPHLPTELLCFRHTHKHMCTHTRVTCAHMPQHADTCAYAHVYTCVHACMQQCMCAEYCAAPSHVCAFMCVCTRALCGCIDTHEHADMCRCTHMSTQMCWEHRHT